MSDGFIPQRISYPGVFVAKESREKVNGRWLIKNDPADQPINEQLREFIDLNGAEITMISNPSIESLVEEKDERVYYVSVTVMYVLPEEGTQDNEPGRTKVG